MDLSPRQSKFLNRVVEAIETEPVNTMDSVAIARFLGVPVQAVREIARIGINQGRIVAVGDSLLYTPRQLRQIEDRFREVSGSEPISPKNLRVALGTSRRYLDGLIAHFDQTGFTVRTERGRVCKA